MRQDIADLNPVKLTPGDCGCERYEVDSSDANGGPMRSVVAFHTCEQRARPRDEKLPARLLKKAKK